MHKFSLYHLNRNTVEYFLTFDVFWSERWGRLKQVIASDLPKPFVPYGVLLTTRHCISLYLCRPRSTSIVLPLLKSCGSRTDGLAGRLPFPEINNLSLLCLPPSHCVCPIPPFPPGIILNITGYCISRLLSTVPAGPQRRRSFY